MIFGRYEFYCYFESTAILPYFKGSTFRGVFGQALKKVVCPLKHQECESCLLKERCIYAIVFETPKAVKVPDGVPLASPPHPFVIEPPLTSRTHFQKGSPFDFNLLLFGEINNSLPYFIYAFDSMGKIGIGKKIEGKRGQFILKSIISGKKIIYCHTDKTLKMPEPQQLVYTENLNTSTDKHTVVTITLETPLRLKFENRLISALPFHVLVRAMLRRVSSLLICYSPDQHPSIDYQRLVRDAQEVNIVESNLKWFDWKRYSSRQDEKMLMGGMLGSVTYEGRLEPFIDLIDFCSKVHIGKQTAFGLGKFKVDFDQ